MSYTMNQVFVFVYSYFKWNDYERKVEYRKPKTGPWLGCGRVTPK